MARLFLIDAMALAYRSFYALGRSSLTTSQGIPTGAIYGAAMFLNKLIGEERPDYLAAVTDTPEPTFRHVLYKEYKATRDKMPDDLAKQVPLIFDLFGLFKMPLVKLPGTEADDVVGTLAVRHAGPDLQVMIVSGDKDFMQIVGEHIQMYSPKKNEEAQIVGVAEVFEKFRVKPEQVVDVLALIGDASDNVPGVKGIGEKGAALLIEKYGSLDGIYAHLSEITAKKQREGLETCKAAAYLSKELVTLKTDVDLPFTLDSLRCEPEVAIANPELLAFYKKFEFKTLAQKTEAAVNHRAKHGGGAAAAGSSGVDGGAGAVVLVEATFTEVSTPGAQTALRSAVAAAKAAGRPIGISIATSGADIAADRATALAVAAGDERFLLPLNEEGIWVARPLLSDPDLKKVTHELKRAGLMLANVGLDVAGPLVDLEISDYLIDPNNYNHSLPAIAARYLESAGPVTQPASQAAAALALLPAVSARVKELGVGRVQDEVEVPLVPVLAAMEREGVYVDAEMLNEYSNELAVMAKKVEAEIYAAAGREFNIHSPTQLQALLFDELKLQDAAGIKRMKKTKTGLSTDESVLLRLAASHPVPKLIVDYRLITKLKNTYVDPLPQYINPKTRRVHTSFRQTVAATGRLSSDRPNLQNIPMRSDLGRKIRAAFRPEEPDWVLVSADYSQVEIRLLAHLAKADGLIEAFRRGLDIHTVTAAKVFGVGETSVTPLQRSRAKAVNFGIIYGMGPQRLAEETGTTLSEAKDFIARYFQVYPGIKSYTEGMIESARATGACFTMMGRRRPIPEINDKSRVMLARAQNIAVNAPIQGSAADLVKLAMIRAHAAIRARRLKARMVLQVHDELVFTTPSSEVQEVVELVREAMEHAMETSVPLKVDVKYGRTWLDAH